MLVTARLRWLRGTKGDWIAIGVLVGLALLVFGLPSLLGRPILPGDDMTQNYPLRVLAGQQIRAGHLPLYNPYIWSGAPLLAGWNAGAAYPLTWLFAILPGLAAWTFGLVATYSIAATGMYGFLRLGPRLRPVASFLGALTFAFGGAMAAQVTHFGLVTGMSWVPLALLAVYRLTAPPDGRVTPPMRPGRRRVLAWAPGAGSWTALLAATVGLVILAGEPRAIADGLIITCLFAAWRLAALALATGRHPRERGPNKIALSGVRGSPPGGHCAIGPASGGTRGRPPGGCLPALVAVAAGVALGVALSAVQLLPGMAAISTSQRAGASLALFSSGSLPVRWLALLLMPDLLGGSGTLSQPGFFGFYNLTEINGYVGILPLVAALALLARLRSWRRLPEWLAWHVMALVGVVLALGGNTPLGPLLARLPFFGTQRLQSRNILILDLALAVLLAYWADQPFPARQAAARADGPERAGPRRAQARWRVPADGVLAAVPAAGVIALGVAGLAGGTRLFNWLDSQAGVSTAVVAALRPWLVPFLVLGVAALALVAFGRRLPAKLLTGLITGLVAADILAFSALAIVQIAPRSPASNGTSVSTGTSASTGTSVSTTASVSTSGAGLPHLTARPVADLGYAGRFAIYDPGLLDTPDLSALQPPDLSAATGTPSVQGYTSIVDGRYALATGSHQATGDGQNTLSPAAVSDGTLDSLDATILLTLPQYASGDLRTVLVPPHWTLAGYDGAFAIYRNHDAAGPLTLAALPGKSAAGASASDPASDGAEVTRVTISSPAGIEVVRSVAAIPGWSSSWQPLVAGSGGAARTASAVSLPVQADGVVQAVDVPPGTGVLTWTYTPPRLVPGLALSLAAAVATLGLWLGPVLRRRRAREGVPPRTRAR